MWTHILRGWKICWSLSVYNGIQSKLLDFCLLTAVCMVTQTETVVINCYENYFVWRSLHSHNTAFLSAYKHIGFHVSNKCAVYIGSRAKADENTHCTAMQDRLQNPWVRGTVCRTQIRLRADYGQWKRWVPMQCGCSGQFVKKFYWNHTYDWRISTQHVSALRLHSA